MTDENWMTRLLSDARDLALQTSRAKLQAQQQQLADADRRIAELTREVAALQREQASARALELRFIGLVRRVLGDPGVVALLELLDAEGCDEVTLLSAAERRLLDRLLEADPSTEVDETQA